MNPNANCLCALIFTVCISACGGGSEAPTDIEGSQAATPTDLKSKQAPSAPPSSAAATNQDTAQRPAAPSLDDEIIPLLNPIPPSLSNDKFLPEDPAEFRKQLKDALKTDTPKEELLSMIDVVLLLNPQDLEMREARANILLKQGFAEDAALDFTLCCKDGRPSCCR
jgi:hypothetical protein